MSDGGTYVPAYHTILDCSEHSDLRHKKSNGDPTVRWYDVNIGGVGTSQHFYFRVLCERGGGGTYGHCVIRTYVLKTEQPWVTPLQWRFLSITPPITPSLLVLRPPFSGLPTTKRVTSTDSMHTFAILRPKESKKRILFLFVFSIHPIRSRLAPRRNLCPPGDN